VRYRVIIEQPKWRRWILWTAVSILLVVAAGAGVLWGVSVAQDQILQNAGLTERVQRLDADNRALRSKATDFELTIETQKATSVALRDELTQLHKVNADLVTELGFFRKIMAPGEVPEGVQIERFEVESFGDLDWIVRVTLIHVAERHRVVAGDVELVLIDSDDGSEIQLSAANEGENLIARNYRFRYFQTIEQPVTLPENVQPKAVKVTVRGKKGVIAETEFAWPVS
jgi:hypothetical protein